MLRSIATVLLLSTTMVMGQRPFFAGSRPIGYPDTPNRTTTVSPLGNRFGEDTTEKLPLEANGDRDLIDRLSKLPIDQQPFWFINWQALEEHRKKPQTFPQKPNVFADRPGASNTNVNFGVPDFNSGASTFNSGTASFNSGTSTFNSGTSNFSSGVPNFNSGASNFNSGTNNTKTGASSNFDNRNGANSSLSSNFGSLANNSSSLGNIQSFNNTQLGNRFGVSSIAENSQTKSQNYNTYPVYNYGQVRYY